MNELFIYEESLDNLDGYEIDIVENRKTEMAQNTSQQTIGDEVGGLRTTNFECKGSLVKIKSNCYQYCRCHRQISLINEEILGSKQS